MCAVSHRQNAQASYHVTPTTGRVGADSPSWSQKNGRRRFSFGLFANQSPFRSRQSSG
jgi:hypothetical protein